MNEEAGCDVHRAGFTVSTRKDRQTSDTMAGPAEKGSRVNLLNWDGKGAPSGMFPPKSGKEKDHT